MAGCLMVVYATLTDRPGFRAYAEATPAIVRQYGGTYRVLNGNPHCLEGDWGFQTAAVSQWPDRESALAFWNSPEYAAAKELRQGKGEFQVIVLDLLDPSPDTAAAGVPV